MLKEINLIARLNARDRRRIDRYFDLSYDVSLALSNIRSSGRVDWKSWDRMLARIARMYEIVGLLDPRDRKAMCLQKGK